MTNMIKLNLQRCSFLALLLVLGAFALPVQAHEYRYLGNGYAIQIGWDTEPAYVGQANALDVFPFYLSNPNDLGTAVALDKSAGDTVELVSVAMLLDVEAYNADPIAMYPMLDPYAQFVGADGIGYQSNFTPDVAGPWGFIITGKLKKAGQAPTLFAKKFVCGAGSRDTVYNTKFNCVETAP